MEWITAILKSLWPGKLFSNNDDTNVKPMLRKIMGFTFLITLLLYICLLLFFCKGHGFVISSVTIVIAAYFISGCILGFIFGIPKKLQNQPQVIRVDGEGKPITEKNNNGISYADNTSLEEISDWITKIVIGLSLVQFREIQKILRDAAAHITASLKTAIDCGKDCNCPVDFFTFSYALIIFYFAAGAIIGYLWTRVVFPQILKDKDDRLAGIIAKKAEKFDEIVRNANEPNFTFGDLSIAPLITTPATISDRGMDIIHKDEDLIAPVKTTLFTDIGDDPDLVRIINNRPPGNRKDDPQKGRWGGLAQSGGYKLSAEVKDYNLPGLYKVKLIVSKTNGEAIEGKVAFVLHDTFNPVYKIYEANESKEVFTEVVAYEAFAVGAVYKPMQGNDYVYLELDLNNIPNVPNGFRWS